MDSPELARRYLDAFVARDYDGARPLLADDFCLRDLSPGGFTQVDGADAAMVGLREFLDMFASIDILEADAYEVAGVTYLRARVHFLHAEAGERMLEQHTSSDSTTGASQASISSAPVCTRRERRGATAGEAAALSAPSSSSRRCRSGT